MVGEKVGSIWVLLKRCNDLRFWKDLLVCVFELSRSECWELGEVLDGGGECVKKSSC